MKLSLITTAAVVAATAAVTFALTHSLSPAQATKVAAPSSIEMTTTAPLATAAQTAMPTQIGGQKLTKDAQSGVNCLITRNNDQAACGQDALNREIAKCLGGIGINGGCFDFFNKPAVSGDAKPQRRDEIRHAGNGSRRTRVANDDWQMMVRDLF